jgi:hypothetical protein
MPVLTDGRIGRENSRMKKTYTAVVERCPETRLYVGYVPGFPGAHSQGETLDELNDNLGEPTLEAEFVGTQTVQVS